MQVTEQMKLRVARDWSEIANEDVDVEVIGGCLYGFASELACLRLAYKYRNSKAENYRVGMSENVSSWYFLLEVA